MNRLSRRNIFFLEAMAQRKRKENWIHPLNVNQFGQQILLESDHFFANLRTFAPLRRKRKLPMIENISVSPCLRGSFQRSLWLRPEAALGSSAVHWFLSA